MNKIKFSSLALSAMALTACFGTDSNDDDNNGPKGVVSAVCETTPPVTSDSIAALTYSFDNRFGTGSSVSYSGQTTRHILLNELIIKIKKMANDGADALSKEDMLAYFNDSETTLDATIESIPGGFTLDNEITKISDINATKNLKGKTSTSVLIDNSEDFKGKTAPELVEAWIEQLAQNAASDKLGTPAVLLDENNRDLSQLIEKLLFGAIAYDQAANKYLAEIGDNEIEVTNSEIPQGYTQAEHHWDEAWGYFGGAVDYASYSDAALSDKNGETSYKDTDENGLLDIQSEVNLGLSKNAGKRDILDCQLNLSRDAFVGFYNGRLALAEGASSTSDDVVDAATEALAAWEKVLAGTTIHYINETIGDQNKYTEEGNTDYSVNDHAKHWSELKGYALALQYNDNAMISVAQLQELQSYIKNEPQQKFAETDEGKAVIEDLIKARDLLGQVYGFEEYLLQNW